MGNTDGMYPSQAMGAISSICEAKAWCIPHPQYRPRDTEHFVLQAIVREHLELCLQEVSDRAGDKLRARTLAWLAHS